MTSTSTIPWTRLVRYSSTEGGPVQYGEPILSHGQNDIDQLARAGNLQVRKCEGEDPFSVQVTDPWKRRTSLSFGALV